MKYLYCTFSIFLLLTGSGIPLVAWGGNDYGDKKSSHACVSANGDEMHSAKDLIPCTHTPGDLAEGHHPVSQSYISIQDTGMCTWVHARLWYPVPDAAIFDMRVPADEFGFLSELIPYYHSFSVLSNQYGVGLGIRLYE